MVSYTLRNATFTEGRIGLEQRLHTNNPTEQQVEEFIRNHPKGHFCQSSLWADVKKGWGRKLVWTQSPDGAVTGALSMLVRKVPGLPFSLFYAPRGPVCDPADKAVLSELMAKAKSLAKNCGGYLLKMDPDIPSADTGFIQTMKSLGFSLSGEGKDFDGVQPRFVFRLEIAGKTEEEVFALFHSKTRYNIRVAQKSGVEVRVCGPEALDDFARLMKTTGERDGFATRPKGYFERLLSALGPHARLYMAYFEGVAIAGTIPIQYGDKTWYLYGSSDNSYRNKMPNYLLQWEMIRWAIQAGSRIYDFRGVSGDLSEDNPLYGLYRFKKGFSGELTEFCGEFNLILRPGVNRLVNALLAARKKISRLRRGGSESAEEKPKPEAPTV